MASCWVSLLFPFPRSEQSGEPDGQVAPTADGLHQSATARVGESIPHEQVPLPTEKIRSGHQLVLVRDAGKQPKEGGKETTQARSTTDAPKYPVCFQTELRAL